MRLLIFLLVAWCCLISPSWAAAGHTALVVVPNEGLFPVGDRRLADALRQEIRGISRFHLLEMPAGPSGEMLGTERRALAIGREVGADTVVRIGFLRDPQARYLRYTDLQGYYAASSEVELTLFDLPEGRLRLRKLYPFYGESPSSKEIAENLAYERLLRDLSADLRKAFRLSATITGREGRKATLDAGEDAGIQVGMFFAGLDGTGNPFGRLRITKVSSASAEGELLSGYEDLTPGVRVYEQAYASFPAAAGISHHMFWQGSFTGVTLEYNRSGFGSGAGLEVGTLSQDGVTGFAMLARWVPQREIRPERLWAYGELGGGGALLSQRIPGGTSHANAFSLHAIAGAGLAGRLFSGLGASLGLVYWTPWAPETWSHTPATSAPLDVSDQVVYPTLGGLGLRVSLTWDF
ncbi:hypothetical protein J7643_19010 [bacterium]|nr:hypothetical protein [bacterium]